MKNLHQVVDDLRYRPSKSRRLLLSCTTLVVHSGDQWSLARPKNAWQSREESPKTPPRLRIAILDDFKRRFLHKLLANLH